MCDKGEVPGGRIAMLRGNRADEDAVGVGCGACGCTSSSSSDMDDFGDMGDDAVDGESNEFLRTSSTRRRCTDGGGGDDDDVWLFSSKFLPPLRGM